ncbi:MAG: hypothetical protein HY581_02625 [Nitrospirae bacterium]|nr:hypothetical protein [Nitrospirota bacterium]
MERGKESAFVIMMAGSIWPTAVFAEESSKVSAGGYGAADYVWFTVIGLILVYGVYDSFFKTP